MSTCGGRWSLRGRLRRGSSNSSSLLSDGTDSKQLQTNSESDAKTSTTLCTGTDSTLTDWEIQTKKVLALRAAAASLHQKNEASPKVVTSKAKGNEREYPDEPEILDPPETFFDESVQVPPVEYESKTELTEKDVLFQGQQIFGINEIEEKSEEFTKPRLPSVIVPNLNRFVVAPAKSSSGRVELPVEVAVPVVMLCVDDNDVIYCRYFQEEVLTPGPRKGRGLQIKTYQELMVELDEYYSDAKIRKQERYNAEEGDKPGEGDVVVVKVSRYAYCRKFPTGYGLTKEFQRARVVSVDKDTLRVTVDLLDDYGHGDVSPDHVFRLKHRFAVFPPQVFSCELKLNQFFEEHKLVHKILRSSPIPRTWRSCTLNPVDITFDGTYSKSALPMVDVKIRVISTPSKWISLKEYVSDNVKNFMSPFWRLVEKCGKTAVCKVLRADDVGNLRIQLQQDLKLLEKLEACLKPLEPLYADRLNYLTLQTSELLPELAKPLEKVKKRIYVALLSKNSNERMLYRVKLVSHFKNTDNFRVHCIDYGDERIARAKQLLPLSCLCEELCGLPALTLKVHLDRISHLDIENSMVKATLFKGDHRVRLVREWPSQAFLPEVHLFPCEEIKDSKSFALQLQMKNIGKMFLRKGVAHELSKEAMEKLEEMAVEYMNNVRKREKEASYFDDAYGRGCSFKGNNFHFVDFSRWEIQKQMIKMGFKTRKMNL